LSGKKYAEIAAPAVRIESVRSLLFSFEKMALRDAVGEAEGTRIFSQGLFDFLYGGASPAERFETWCAAVESLPRKRTRVMTWPLVTVFSFIAQPRMHIFLKPNTAREAARVLGLHSTMYRGLIGTHTRIISRSQKMSAPPFKTCGHAI
jgi:hypothetical protein